MTFYYLLNPILKAFFVELYPISFNTFICGTFGLVFYQVLTEHVKEEK